MSKEKQARRKAAGPSMDPQAMSMQMSPIPGAPPGPGNMNGNPMNISSLGTQLPSMDPNGFQDSIYRDGKYQYPQMGANILNPSMVPRSPTQQNTPMTTIGNNSGIPFGLQSQPPLSSEEPMEGMRLGQQAMERGVFANPFMGPVGSEAIMPGAFAGAMPGTSGPPMLPPMTSMNPMTPGADKKVVKKKGKK
jgi:hypothetical protein